MKKLIPYTIFFMTILSCSSNIYFDSKISINLESCEINYNLHNANSDKILSETYIVGHAYGEPGKGDFFPERLTSYFNNNLDADIENNIALTGDFVRESSVESFLKVRNYIESNFNDYLISIGNHELNSNSLENYLSVFEKEFYFKEFENYLIISPNFSNPNWLPSNEQVTEVNKLINNTEKDYIVILSHQLFWLNETNGDLVPNSDDLLKNELPRDPLSWIDSSKTKNFIIISGDYGAFGAKPYCKQDGNKLYIANGIGDTEKDSIIKIINKENNFEIIEINLEDAK